MLMTQQENLAWLQVQTGIAMPFLIVGITLIGAAIVGIFMVGVILFFTMGESRAARRGNHEHQD